MQTGRNASLPKGRSPAALQQSLGYRSKAIVNMTRLFHLPLALALLLVFLLSAFTAANTISVMIYSYSFGAFRGETYSPNENKTIWDNIKQYPRYFFHSDDSENNTKSSIAAKSRDIMALLLDGWILQNISEAIDNTIAILVNGNESSTIITNHSVHLVGNHNRMKVKKMTKFLTGLIQHVAKDFDYAMHLDFSVFGSNKNSYFVPSYADLSAMLGTNSPLSACFFSSIVAPRPNRDLYIYIGLYLGGYF
jgi:hypothetical protein